MTCPLMLFVKQKQEKSKIKRWLLEEDEMFQKRKCAYLLTNLRGMGRYKPICYFLITPFVAKEAKKQKQKNLKCTFT
jgi:hypothetical protein